MVDPRDEVIDSDDCLTEDSNDEVNDLVKEFEAKYAELKQKRKLKRKSDSSSSNTLSITTASTSGHNSHGHGNNNVNAISGTKGANGKSGSDSLDSSASPFMSNKLNEKASSFINKLYESNYKQAVKKANIDYSQRVFEFDTKSFNLNENIDANELDPYSNQYLRKRYFPSRHLNDILTSTDKNLKILRIDKLLAKVNKTNHFAEPVYTNWGFVGIVLQKEATKLTKDKKKFMKISVGDFNRSVDIMFFGDALQKYFKLRPGDLIIILNPIVNKYHYQPANSNKIINGFNLKVDEDNVNSILEIGAARDFGYCNAINKNNTKCTTIINISKTDICEFHLNLRFKGVSNKRMELNGSVQMKSPQKPKYLTSAINEDSIVYHGSRAGFMDNPESYQNPKLLSQEAKRRKLLDSKANKTLEKKLASLGNNHTVKVLQLVKDQPKVTKEDNIKLLEQRQRGFPTDMIGKIGFDPTTNDKLFNSTGIEGYKSPNRKRREIDRIRELYDLSNNKSKQKQLTSSPENKKSKHDKWKANLDNLKQYEKKIQTHQINQSTYDNLDNAINGKPEVKFIRTKSKIVDEDDTNRLESGFSTTDESDIEIEFDNDDAKKQFQKKMGYKNA